MIKINSNLEEVVSSIIGRLKSIIDISGPTYDKMIRTSSFDVLPHVKKRIHVEGKKSDGNNIGTYSNSYIKYRAKNKRGKDNKVILSFSRQMENDFSVVEGNDNKYGLGFKNKFNAEKANWLQNGRSAHSVKEHVRVVGRKSNKFLEKKYDSIVKIQEEISDNTNDTVRLSKLNKRLNSLKKQYEKAQGNSIKVKAHQRKGWKGYGEIYKLSDKEVDVVKNSMQFFIKNLL